MKKLISMMLMLCAVITFSACSSDDDGPSNPVSNPTVPQSAKIGAEVTIQGTGFAAGQTLWLVPEQGEAVNVNAKMATSGAKFTVPYTLNEGKVDVVLQVENNKWTLGSMTLLAAEKPITALSVPSGLALGKEVTIAGIGFAEGDKIVLIPVANAAKSYMIDKTPQGTTVDATVTADGIKFTVPADLTEGEYTVSLVRGKYTWALGTTAVYVDRRIESITISDHPMLSEPLTATFHYNNDGALEKITTNDQYVWEFAYSGNTVTVAPVTMPLEKLTYTLDENGRITSSTGFSMTTGEEVVYAWNYDAEGHLVSIVDKVNAESQENLTAKYENGDLSEYNLIFTNNFTTNKSFRVRPNTTEPAYLVNIFALMMTREDLFLGFLLNRNVTTSTYVPNKLLAGDYNENYEMIQNEAPIETGFENNTLTLKTTGMYISAGQSMFGNTVTVKYQNK